MHSFSENFLLFVFIQDGERRRKKNRMKKMIIIITVKQIRTDFLFKIKIKIKNFAWTIIYIDGLVFDE